MRLNISAGAAGAGMWRATVAIGKNDGLRGKTGQRSQGHNSHAKGQKPPAHLRQLLIEAHLVT